MKNISKKVYGFFKRILDTETELREVKKLDKVATKNLLSMIRVE